MGVGVGLVAVALALPAGVSAQPAPGVAGERAAVGLAGKIKILLLETRGHETIDGIFSGNIWNFLESRCDESPMPFVFAPLQDPFFYQLLFFGLELLV